MLTVAILYRGKCGLSKGTTRYMVAMAISNLLVLIAHVLIEKIYMYYTPNSFLFLTAICPSNIYLRVVTLDYSVWLTMSFTFDRFVSICCPKLRLAYCTDRTAVMVIVSLWPLSCLKFIPFNFMYVPRLIVDSVKWECRPKRDFFISGWWLVFSWMCTISLPLLPILIMVLFNGLTVRNIIAANRVRRRLKATDSGKDTEAENRRKSIVLLFTVSGAFILLWTTVTVSFICTRVTVNFAGGDHSSPFYIANEVGVLLTHVSSCANSCIYGMTQRKFRLEVKNAFTHLTSIVQLMTPAR
ncbi:probable G-protein coupled receptor 139 [Amblyraja radiata]|uniref:probable G-protein coupled receptor 139 n=1 Tax=Amblyraja radiata TaxID=386614 RepID=UPI0014036F0E|nr:probable G-protein coupled receptor 139 [Amblyraja radiata]